MCTLISLKRNSRQCKQKRLLVCVNYGLIWDALQLYRLYYKYCDSIQRELEFYLEMINEKQNNKTQRKSIDQSYIVESNEMINSNYNNELNTLLVLQSRMEQKPAICFILGFNVTPYSLLTVLLTWIVTRAIPYLVTT